MRTKIGSRSDPLGSTRIRKKSDRIRITSSSNFFGSGSDRIEIGVPQVRIEPQWDRIGSGSDGIRIG